MDDLERQKKERRYCDLLGIEQDLAEQIAGTAYLQVKLNKQRLLKQAADERRRLSRELQEDNPDWIASCDD